MGTTVRPPHLHSSVAALTKGGINGCQIRSWGQDVQRPRPPAPPSAQARQVHVRQRNHLRSFSPSLVLFSVPRPSRDPRGDVSPPE